MGMNERIPSARRFSQALDAFDTAFQSLNELMEEIGRGEGATMAARGAGWNLSMASAQLADLQRLVVGARDVLLRNDELA